MPKVSVIVPNYNHAPFLRRRIDTILAQTFQDFELILLDDASTDDSRSILLSYSSDTRVRLEFNQSNSGSPFKQWNKGISLARSEYVWIAESDDYADPHFLERLVLVLDSKPEVAFVSCRSWQINELGELQGFADYYLVDVNRYERGAQVDGLQECRNSFVHLNPVCNASSVLFRRRVYESVGGADENLRFCGDWKLWAAMALTGCIIYLKESLNYHRIHEKSVTANSQRAALCHAEYLRVSRWMLRSVSPTEAAREELHRNLPWAWLPAVTRWRVPLRRRYSMMRDAIAINPGGILRRIIPEGLIALRLKSLKRWRSSRSGLAQNRNE